MEQGKSCLITKEMDFTLDAYGKNKTEAVGKIFSMFKKKAYASVDGLIIHIEPKDVVLIEEKEKTKTEKFMGFFMPKEVQNYYVKLKIISTVKYIPL